MPHSTTRNDFKIGLGQLKSSLRLVHSGLANGKDPSERLMLSSNRETGYSQTRTQKLYSAYDCRTFPVYRGQFSLSGLQFEGVEATCRRLL